MKHYLLSDRNLVEDWSDRWEQLVYLITDVICLNHSISEDDELKYRALRSWFRHHQDGFTPIWHEFLSNHERYLYDCSANEGPQPRPGMPDPNSRMSNEREQELLWLTLRPYKTSGNRPPWLVSETPPLPLISLPPSFLDIFDTSVALTHNPFEYFLQPESFLEVIRLMCFADDPRICHDCELKETCDDAVFTALLDSSTMAGRLKSWVDRRAV